ncbi:MarR family winged helix-turn-helix transcriptional regulator [Rubellimicrobium arenae]|uniref:MarR family winged helix-turn-helix transcriptional regulator n=1 Tax=Rubellimicrobium arenae TaxID=2817372 RepID=UPI001B30E28D|nr:MarR family winged helix-turn-helix transcriptional regulator [Rubellimicrobium arenae]
MDEPISDSDFRTLATFRRELRQFLQFSEAAALSQGLSPQQYQALLAIRGADGQQMTVGNLAETLLLRPHSASGLVSRLETIGMVERHGSEEDGRRRVVKLSTRAKALLDTLSAAHRSELRRRRALLTTLLDSLG